MMSTVLRGLLIIASICTVNASSAQTSNTTREITIDELVEKLKIVNTAAFLDARCRQLEEDTWIELFWYFTEISRAYLRPEFMPATAVLQESARRDATIRPCDAESAREAKHAVEVARSMLFVADGSAPQYNNEVRVRLMFSSFVRAVGLQISDDACQTLGNRRAEVDDYVMTLASEYFVALDRMGAQMQMARIGEFVTLVRQDFEKQIKDAGRSADCEDAQHKMKQVMFEIGMLLRRPVPEMTAR